MASSQETVSMFWDDHDKDTAHAFEKLKDGSKFTDVTLVCEDGKQLEALFSWNF